MDFYWRRKRDSFSPEGSVRVGSDLPPAGHSLPTRSNPYNKETEPYTRYDSTSLAQEEGFEPPCLLGKRFSRRNTPSDFRRN